MGWGGVNFDCIFINQTHFFLFVDYVTLSIFQPYRDLEAGDNLSLKS